MKRVITYGTFDLLHYGHINLLKRAKALGDYLIVGLSTNEFNRLERIKNVILITKKENLYQRLSDMWISSYQKKIGIKKSQTQKSIMLMCFVIGDDWQGKFDYLSDMGIEVVYLSRTKEISTSKIKNDLNQGNQDEISGHTCNRWCKEYHEWGTKVFIKNHIPNNDQEFEYMVGESNGEAHSH